MRRLHTRKGARATFVLSAFVAVATATTVEAGLGAWDHASNIADSAKRLAILHMQQGSTGVLKFLDACYRTQMLNSEFTAGLESCMAQDYMHSQVLAKIYAAIPDEERRKMGTPSPEQIADSMGRRFVAAFSQYKISVKDAETFKNLVDKNGLPIFVKAIFPKKPKADDGTSGGR